jgi:uncharacterized protein YjbI with pentapeptide repeats
MKKTMLALMLLIISVIVGVATASAFNPADLHKLRSTGNCVECDLSGAALIHWNLSGADLSGANLAGANLTDAYLAGANLSGANLSKAILEGASLAHANLSKAKLSGTNLYVVDLSGATLTDRSGCDEASDGSCKR